MIILPAIDIIDSKPVRLYQGDYGKREVVAESVLDTAKAFEKAGASWIHLVDLDAAKAGKRINHELISKTAQSLSIPVEVGGGIRTMEDVDWYVNNGISRVILGTAAFKDPEFVKTACKKYPGKIAVGIDCLDGIVKGSGWLEDSGEYYLDFAKKMQEAGVSAIIFTDISRDGTLSGPNLAMLEALKNAVDIDIIASGGIKDLKDIKDLAFLNLYGAITGKAMYAGTLDLKEAIHAGEKHAE